MPNTRERMITGIIVVAGDDGGRVDVTGSEASRQLLREPLLQKSHGSRVSRFPIDSRAEL